MKKLYLDVDGVVLTKCGEPALHLMEFLRSATERFDCHWLTSRCQGDARRVVDDLIGIVPDEALPYLSELKPTSWRVWKTEAIDFSSDFVWLDDYAFDGERAMLAEHGAAERLVLIDLTENPDRLREIAAEIGKGSGVFSS
ncbi:MAG: hypothetical protein HGA38_02690 [Candidatus Moranbacteria bacterium]|nr:hypothetical protein [Candidatus Moranbacteria bacterium]